MATFYTTDAEGVTRLDPSLRLQRSVVAGVLGDPEAINEVWMVHCASDWALSVFPTGLVQLERPGEAELEIGPLEIGAILELWQLLAEGHLRELALRAWRPSNAPV